MPVLQVPSGEDGMSGGFPNILKEEEQEDSLVVEESMLVKFPMVRFVTCLLHLKLLLQGSCHQEEVKQPHCRDT